MDVEKERENEALALRKKWKSCLGNFSWVKHFLGYVINKLYNNESLIRWICIRCGDHILIKENQVGTRLLFSSCGSKKYKDELLICCRCSNRTCFKISKKYVP